MVTKVPITLRIAIVCGVLLVLQGIGGMLWAPIIASNLVDQLRRTEDVNQWYSISADTVGGFINVSSLIQVSLSLAIVVLVSVAARSKSFRERDRSPESANATP